MVCKRRGGGIMKIDQKLYLLRKKNGLSQMEVANELNTSRQAISKWETGVAIPSSNNLISLSKLYSIPLDALVNEDIDISESKNAEFELKSEQTVKPKKRRSYVYMAVAVLVFSIAVVSVLLGFGHFRTGQANDSLRLTDPGVSVEEDIGKLEEGELSPS